MIVSYATNIFLSYVLPLSSLTLSLVICLKCCLKISTSINATIHQKETQWKLSLWPTGETPCIYTTTNVTNWVSMAIDAMHSNPKRSRSSGTFSITKQRSFGLRGYGGAIPLKDLVVSSHACVAAYSYTQ